MLSVQNEEKQRKTKKEVKINSTPTYHPEIIRVETLVNFLFAALLFISRIHVSHRHAMAPVLTMLYSWLFSFNETPWSFPYAMKYSLGGEMIIQNFMLFWLWDSLSPTDRFISSLASLNRIYILVVTDDTGMNILVDKSFSTSLIISQKISKRNCSS